MVSYELPIDTNKQSHRFCPPVNFGSCSARNFSTTVQYTLQEQTIASTTYQSRSGVSVPAFHTAPPIGGLSCSILLYFLHYNTAVVQAHDVPTLK